MRSSSLFDQDQFSPLRLTQEEAAVWMPRLLRRIAPCLARVRGLVEQGLPINQVQPVIDECIDEIYVFAAEEMASAVLTPQRIQELIPILEGYCDRLLETGRGREAAFVQHGLLQIATHSLPPHKNSLLVAICARSLILEINLESN